MTFGWLITRYVLWYHTFIHEGHENQEIDMHIRDEPHWMIILIGVHQVSIKPLERAVFSGNGISQTVFGVHFFDFLKNLCILPTVFLFNAFYSPYVRTLILSKRFSGI